MAEGEIQVFLGSNLKFLRLRKSWTQEMLSRFLGIKRSSYKDYELNSVKPSLRCLIKISEIFSVSIDDLIRVDLRLIFDQWEAEQHKGSIIETEARTLVVSVDTDGEQNVDWLTPEVYDRYLQEFNRPAFIQELPKIQLPMLEEGTFRAFTLLDHEMSPDLPKGAIFLGKYVKNISDIENFQPYLILHQTYGLICRNILMIPETESMMLFSNFRPSSFNTVPYHEVKEIWAYQAVLRFDASRKAAQFGELVQLILQAKQDFSSL